MCGIIGYAGGTREASQVLLTALGRMEYRGYDSIGITVQAEEGLAVRKTVGRLPHLTSLLAERPVAGRCVWKRAGDVTILHYALHSPMSDAIRRLPGVRVLQYHNVTPAHFFAPYEPAIFRLATLSREDLGTLVGPPQRPDGLLRALGKEDPSARRRPCGRRAGGAPRCLVQAAAGRNGAAWARTRRQADGAVACGGGRVFSRLEGFREDADRALSRQCGSLVWRRCG